MTLYLLLDESSQGKEVEEVGKGLPDVGIAVFSQALVIETVHLSDLTTFVIACAVVDKPETQTMATSTPLNIGNNPEHMEAMTKQEAHR